MDIFTRPVHIGLSPNLTTADFWRVVKELIMPWKWRSLEEVVAVESWFKDYYQVATAVAFNSGRSALFAILSLLDIPKESEVLLQAFTCVAVPNSVRWAGLKPVYVDIDQTLNLDVTDAAKKITSKTKVMIVQHTFGVPADMEKITAFCKKHKLILIEDCAHALGATYRGRVVGSFGIAAIFSFGRDKIVSSVFGGVAITSDDQLGRKLLDCQSKLPQPNIFWIAQQLLHPIITHIALRLYSIQLGKMILWLAQKLRLLSLPVYKAEMIGKQPSIFPKKYSGALAHLLIPQLMNLENINQMRQNHARSYIEKLKSLELKLPTKVPGSIYMRFNVQTSSADQLRFGAKQMGMILGSWYSHVIDPRQVDVEMVGYQWGSCPRAEKAALQSLNLPTYPTLTETQNSYIIKFLQKYANAEEN